MGAVILALHVFGWGVLIFGVAPQHITLGSAVSSGSDSA